MGGPWRGLSPQCLACGLYRRSVWPPLSLQGCDIAQPPAQRVSKTNVVQSRAWLHNQVSAFTGDQSRRGERSALTSSSCHQHLMKTGYSLQGTGPETLSPFEGTPSPDCWARAYFLSDPINLVVLAELWQSLSADTESTPDPLVSLRWGLMACSYFFTGAFVDLDLNVPVPQLSFSSCENKHANMVSCTMGITKIAG